MKKQFLAQKIGIKKIHCSDKKDLKKFFLRKKFYAIIHTAALFANQKSIDQPLEDLRSNVIGTLNLLEYAKNNKIKIINFSSSCVYSTPNTNEMIYKPSFDTPYAISKFSGEQYCSFSVSYTHLTLPTIYSV